jgi:hypothetical protein
VQFQVQGVEEEVLTLVVQLTLADLVEVQATIHTLVAAVPAKVIPAVLVTAAAAGPVAVVAVLEAQEAVQVAPTVLDRMAVLACHLVLLAQQYCEQVAVLAVTKVDQPQQADQAVADQADQTVLMDHNVMQL